MDGGMLAMDTKQNLSTVWRRDRNILSMSNNATPETLLGVGDQPWITSGEDGFYCVWTSKRDGDLLLAKPGSTNIERIAGNASYPVTVSTSQPALVVYVFWENRLNQSFSIMGQRIK